MTSWLVNKHMICQIVQPERESKIDDAGVCQKKMYYILHTQEIMVLFLPVIVIAAKSQN